MLTESDETMVRRALASAAEEREAMAAELAATRSALSRVEGALHGLSAVWNDVACELMDGDTNGRMTAIRMLLALSAVTAGVHVADALM